MFAILSDIHANLEALSAVLADIERHNVDAVLCLGDLVGYGPNPVECIALCMEMDLVLLGNFDSVIVHRDESEASVGRLGSSSLSWTRRALEQTDCGRACLQFLQERPNKHIDGTTTYVHGTARAPTYEYLFPEDVYNLRKMDAVAKHFERLCFCGHSHIPGVFEGSLQEWSYLEPQQCEPAHTIQGDKTIVNVGAVGQPRDGDPRACYVLYDGSAIRFRRIEYDFRETARKIRDLPDLDDSSGERLGAGR